MAETEATVEVVDNADERRYDLLVDGALGGMIVYRDRGEGVRELVHTEVKPELGGRGLAAVVAKAALDDIRARGWKVIPSCPYVAAYVEKHPDYADLVTTR